jgi:hypothetical protein
MKKLKIMLLSLALLAILGGTLAFKARFQSIYCTAPVGEDGACTLQCPDETFSTTYEGINWFCTTTPHNGVCVDEHGDALECLTSTHLTID